MKTLKRVYLIFIFCFLFIFLAQKELKLFKIKPLDGVLPKESALNFMWKRFFDLSWQESLTVYINDNLGFRPMLVRHYNQLSYKLFNRIRNQGIIPGKNKNLFVDSYIINYLGLT